MEINRGLLTQEELLVGATYFVYHLRMYLESLFWFHENYSDSGLNIQKEQDKVFENNLSQNSDSTVDIEEDSTTWAFFKNAILDVNLVHARVLIDFFCKAEPRKTDIVAWDYYEQGNSPFPVVDEYLINQSRKIGARLVHLTKHAIPEIKSYQNWEIRKLAEGIVELVNLFIEESQENYFPPKIKNKCLRLLKVFNENNIPFNLRAST